MSTKFICDVCDEYCFPPALTLKNERGEEEHLCAKDAHAVIKFMDRRRNGYSSPKQKASTPIVPSVPSPEN